MAGTWFDRHERFGDCKPNEVYIGQNVFAEFSQHPHDVIVRLRKVDGPTILIDEGSVSILAGAMKEWRERK